MDKKVDSRRYESWIVPIDVARMLYVRGFDGLLFYVWENDRLRFYGESDSITSGEWMSNDFCLCLDELFEHHPEIYHLTSLPAPTYEQAFEWVRSKRVYGEITRIPKVNAWVYYAVDERDGVYKVVTGEGDDYEKVRLDCLVHCLEFIEVL